MKKIPIGIQHFPLLIEEGYLYVDKTESIYHMVKDRAHFFSRPRRFGKSLLVSTLATLFQAKREFFETTWIHTSDYRWQNYPLIWLDFSTLVGQDRSTVELSLQQALLYAAEDGGIPLTRGVTAIDTFIAFIKNASKLGPVVIVIDEYDHPLLKVLNDPDELVKNGYSFSKIEPKLKVYNPLSIHLFLKEASLSNFWFGTATPTFAIDLIRSENYPIINFENEITIGISLQENHEVTSPNLIPLLFQTGYLTIEQYDEERQTYQLNFPNEEVRISFFNHLLKGFTQLDETQLAPHFHYLTIALKEGKLNDFMSSLNALLAEIPYSLHIAKESYYHSLIYLIMRALKVNVEAEVSTSLGRLDLIINEKERIYIFEFKFDSSAKEALAQIIKKNYSQQFNKSQQKIILVGIDINRQKRMIDEWLEQELIN